MNKYLLSVTAFALVTVALGTGLALSQSSAAAAETSSSNQPDPLQFARGAKSWADNCSRCHNMRDPKELRDDQWRAAMMHMRVRAGLTGAETEDILKFLQGSN